LFMKSRAGLSGHLATDRSKIWETGIVSKSASQRTPGGYDLIQGAAGMTYSYLRERTAWATLQPLVSERKEKLTRLVHQPIVNSQPLASGHVVGSPEEVINPSDKGEREMRTNFAGAYRDQLPALGSFASAMDRTLQQREGSWFVDISKTTKWGPFAN
jgi:hypothetical protein